MAQPKTVVGGADLFHALRKIRNHAIVFVFLQKPVKQQPVEIFRSFIDSNARIQAGR